MTVTEAAGPDPCHLRTWLLDSLLNSLDGSFHLWSRGTNFFPIRNTGILLHMTILHISTVWQSTTDASEPRDVDSEQG